jgi:hypothetical protein
MNANLSPSLEKHALMSPSPKPSTTFSDTLSAMMYRTENGNCSAVGANGLLEKASMAGPLTDLGSLVPG